MIQSYVYALTDQYLTMLVGNMAQKVLLCRVKIQRHLWGGQRLKSAGSGVLNKSVGHLKTSFQNN